MQQDATAPPAARPHPWTIAVVAVVVIVAVVGLLLRIWVLTSPAGVLNADEAYTGLQAMEIVQGRYAAVIEGTSYTAVLDSYLFAPVAWLVGAHVVLLKLLPVAIWAVASLVAAAVANAILGRRAALLAGCFLWLAPGTMIIVSTRAYPGYAIGMAFVLGALWAATGVVRDEKPDWRRSLLTGFLAGLGIYAHPMYFAVLVPLLAVVCVVHWRRVRTWWLPALVGGIAANLPFLIWNAWHEWPSLNQELPATDSYTDRLSRFFSGLLPRMVGARSQNDSWIYNRGLGTVVTIAIAAVAVYGAVVLGRRGRLGLLVVVPLAAAFPLMALLSPLAYVADGRYGIAPLPFIVLALAAAVDQLAGRTQTTGRTTIRSAATVGAALVAWVAILCVPFLRSDAGDRRIDPNADLQAAIDRVEEAGFDRVAGSFWLMMPVEYASDRQLRAGIAGQPLVVRVPSSQAVYAAAPPERVAMLFPTWDDQPGALPLPLDHYERSVLGQVVLYLPIPGAASS